MRINKKSRGLLLGLLVLLSLCLGVTAAWAAEVKEGRTGERLREPYVVIVNTRMPEGGQLGYVQPENMAGAVSYRIGEVKQLGGADYVCIGLGVQCVIWMESQMKTAYDAAQKTTVIAQDIASVYDGEPYTVLRSLAGGTVPCMDGSGKLSIMLDKLDSASGMYKMERGLTALHLDTPEASAYQPGEMHTRAGLLVHEGQHALLDKLTGYRSGGRQNYLWLNEGLSVAAMDYLWGGIDSSGWLTSLQDSVYLRSGSSLVYSSYRGSTAQDYGLPYLFVRYLIDRMAGGYRPMAILPRFYQVQAQGMDAVAYLEQVTEEKFTMLLSDFYCAVAAGDFYGDSVAEAAAKTYPRYPWTGDQVPAPEEAGAVIIDNASGSFTVPTNADSYLRYFGVGTAVVSAIGEGSVANPYVIRTEEDLGLLNRYPDAQFILGSDVTVTKESALYLSPRAFSGSLDGRGHRISGLAQPLVRRNQGTIQNLEIVAAFTGDYSEAWGVFACENAGTIRRCRLTGSIEGRLVSQGALGGIAGLNTALGKIEECLSAVNIQLIGAASANAYVGGIVGIHQGGSISNSLHSAKIKVQQGSGVKAGGIAGYIRREGAGYPLPTVQLCVSDGQITAEGAAAGQLGGAVDEAIDPAALPQTIRSCYVQAEQGALFGEGEVPDTLAVSVSAQQMLSSENLPALNFDAIWKISDGRVTLREDIDIQEISIQRLGSLYVGCCVPAGSSIGELQVNGGGAIPITAEMISELDTSRAGSAPITITYRGQTVHTQLTVQEPPAQLTLRISARPKTSYIEGEQFDPTGLMIYGYSAEAQAYLYITSGYTWEQTEPLTPEQASITLTYYGHTVELPITVQKRAVQSIRVIRGADRSHYTTGDLLDTAGIRLQLTYNDGSTSPILNAEESETYGLHLALVQMESRQVREAKAVTMHSPLAPADDGAMLAFYAGEKQPGQYGSVYTLCGELQVEKPLRITDTALYISNAQMQQWAYTGNVEGGSGSYKATIIREDLPEGISRRNMPGENGSLCFQYTGQTSTRPGRYTCVYRVEDTALGGDLTVTVQLDVVGSDTARMHSFVLEKAWNSVLTQDVIGIIDEQQGTITLHVPAGTPVSALQPTVDFGYSYGASLPMAMANGTKHDFTDPVLYVVTAPDGVTTKLYRAQVFFDTPQPGGQEQNTPETEQPSETIDAAAEDIATGTDNSTTTQPAQAVSPTPPGIERALPRTQIRSVRAKKNRSVTIRWKKVKASGYELLVARDAKCTKGVKRYSIRSYKTTRKQIKRLKKGRFYCKIRVRKKVNGRYLYGAWSKIRKMNIK